MSEISVEAKVHIIHMRCDECGAGLMEDQGLVLTSDPLKYVHKCNNCGHEESYKHSYPYQKLVPVSDHYEDVVEEDEDDDL